MAGLRVADVDSVQENGHLVGTSSPDADIGLGSHVTPLTHIHSGHRLEDVIDAHRRKGGYGRTVQHRDDSCASGQCHRHPRGCD